jgi:hypothetical protein
MKMKINWLYTGLLGAALATAGCGGSPTAQPQLTPTLTMYSSTLNFGDVAVGATTELGVTFANTGVGPLTLQQNSITGPGFTTSGIGTGVTVVPGQYVTLEVSFSPAATGTASGTVSITSNAQTTPISLPLSGNGVLATHSAALQWQASSSPVVGYNVYLLSTSALSWNKLNSSPIPTTSYTDWDVQGGNIYSFAVTSVSATNVESAPSNVAPITVPSP